MTKWMRQRFALIDDSPSAASGSAVTGAVIAIAVLAGLLGSGIAVTGAVIAILSEAFSAVAPAARLLPKMKSAINLKP